MSDLAKINTSHLSRLAYVYLRQSSPAQVEHNRESTARQYALVAKAADLGWPAPQVLVIDEISAFPAQALSHAAVLRGSPRRSHWAMSVSCSAWRSRASPVTTPIGIACSICAA